MYCPDLTSITDEVEAEEVDDEKDDIPFNDYAPTYARKCVEDILAGSKVLFVGWLDAKHSYTKGEVTPEFVKGLQALCRKPKYRYKGRHRCDFCAGHYVAAPAEKGTSNLASADIEVRGENTIYLAPALIIHYVATHGYLPPQEFIDAVLATRV